MKTLAALFFFLLSASALATTPHTVGVNSGGQIVDAGPSSGVFTLSLRSANFGATGDAGSMSLPSIVTKYMVAAVNIMNCSVTPILASVGIYTGASATGTTVLTAGTITGATSSAVVLSPAQAAITLTAATLYVNVSVANAAALTCDIYVTIRDLS